MYKHWAFQVRYWWWRFISYLWMGKLNHGNVKAHILRNSLKFQGPTFCIFRFIQTWLAFHSQSYLWAATIEDIHSLEILCLGPQIKYLKTQPSLGNLKENPRNPVWKQHTAVLCPPHHTQHPCVQREPWSSFVDTGESEPGIRLWEVSVTWLSSTVSVKQCITGVRVSLTKTIKTLT